MPAPHRGDANRPISNQGKAKKPDQGKAKKPDQGKAKKPDQGKANAAGKPTTPSPNEKNNKISIPNNLGWNQDHKQATNQTPLQSTNPKPEPAGQKAHPLC
ncbi:hypothetical protein [Paraburkholderia elongata]|uniref:Uncharacterized protein n=1 Tax=Paraburkholderia elongata TaxID=2675747 RepID=A0A972SK09_9BURK|nr:hypothetical protein [Paraburkholderia elongata]NPT58558.1 hypothetical protein [Paraburkholderia elongata]